MADLKLAKLRDRTPVKITIHLSPDLNQALGAYADVCRETYGETEPVQELIPAMLASFLESDRAFVQRRRKGAPSMTRGDVAPAEPISVRIPEAVRLTGLSRSRI
jgi:hypothetical protein